MKNGVNRYGTMMYRNVCKGCNAEDRKRYYYANHARCRETQRNNYRRLMAEDPIKTRVIRNGYSKKERVALRLEFIQQYGGVCVCCGEDEIQFLTLEHTQNDGAKERSEIGANDAILRRMRKAGWPKDRYALLCYNCNMAKGKLGYCPHRLKRNKKNIG